MTPPSAPPPSAPHPALHHRPRPRGVVGQVVLVVEEAGVKAVGLNVGFIDHVEPQLGAQLIPWGFGGGVWCVWVCGYVGLGFEGRVMLVDGAVTLAALAALQKLASCV